MATRRRRNSRKKYDKPTLYLMLALVFITVPFLFNAINFQIQKSKLEARKAELNRQINEEAEKKQLYLEELDRVGTPEYYEYLARKYLGYIYPDEKVLVVLDPAQEGQ